MCPNSGHYDEGTLAAAVQEVFLNGENSTTAEGLSPPEGPGFGWKAKNGCSRFALLREAASGQPDAKSKAHMPTGD